jgi:hypothetical protein
MANLKKIHRVNHLSVGAVRIQPPTFEYIDKFPWTRQPKRNREPRHKEHRIAFALLPEGE